jgi:hypothetical protein
MKTATYEGIVENGQIRLVGAANLPEHATVHIVAPAREPGRTIHIRSPRLAQPELAVEFVKEIIEDRQDAGLRRRRRRFLCSHCEIGLLGRNVLNYLRLLLDGPARGQIFAVGRVHKTQAFSRIFSAKRKLTSQSPCSF